MDLKNKKVLLMGLGVLGGGAATARWLFEQGAALTITDLKNEEYLTPSLQKLEDIKNKIKWVLGRHEEKDFLENDVIVINPDVPADNKFVNLARENGKEIENELTLFYKFCPSRKIIAVTGTRGKTTTVNWIAHFLLSQYPDTLVIGNSPEKPFLQEIKKCKESTYVVIEAPSYHLEIANGSNFAPHIALITNLYRDHINRHKSMEEYAAVKANIFVGQKENDFLILNKDNKWTDFFLNLKPKAKVIFPSKTNFPEFASNWGEHNLLNLLASSLAAKLMGVSEENIEKSIATLPQMKYRQEKIYEKGELEIYNDSAATSPEAAMAAAKRFKNCVLIGGGTDKELDFAEWAEFVNNNIGQEKLILLSGSATEKMKTALSWGKYNEFGTLEECLASALETARMKGIPIIVFSPGAKSFEKFKNEFDRGEQFNFLVNKL